MWTCDVSLSFSQCALCISCIFCINADSLAQNQILWERTTGKQLTFKKFHTIFFFESRIHFKNPKGTKGYVVEFPTSPCFSATYFPFSEAYIVTLLSDVFFPDFFFYTFLFLRASIVLPTPAAQMVACYTHGFYKLFYVPIQNEFVPCWYIRNILIFPTAVEIPVRGGATLKK